MDSLSEFQQRASAVAVHKLLTGTYFSISDLDAIAQTMGRKAEMAGQDYAALRSLHCVHWVDMGPELAQMVREKCLELLGLPPRVVDMATPASNTDQPRQDSAPEKKVRLAFWKQH